jgi:hypothetical protein
MNEEAPIIYDAVVVTDEEANNSIVVANPPAINPNHVAAAPPTTPAITTTTVNTYRIPPPLSTPTTYTHLGRYVENTFRGSFYSIYICWLTEPFLLDCVHRTASGMQCPYCNRQTITTTHDIIGVGTVVAVILLAICCWPLCWLPFCIPSCKRTHHFCGHDACRKKVGETSVCS